MTGQRYNVTSPRLSRVPDLLGAADRLSASVWLTLDGGVSSGRIRVEGRDIIMLGSNDYLGMATHPRVIARARKALDDHGAGTGMNPVLGLPRVHRELIDAMRAFTGSEDVLLFNSCTAANCALIPGLVGPDDTVISDELNHASIVDGCRLSRARTLVYKHGDLEALDQALHDAGSSGSRLVVTDGVFSMEGVAAPLPELLRSTERGDAMLAVDESHAAGVLGATGRGTRELFNIPADAIIQTGTFSKAFGAGIGGYVAGSRDLVAHLRSRARFFIFTSGMPATAAGAALGALDVLADEPEVLDRLRSNTVYMRKELESLGFEVLGQECPILPVLVDGEERAHRISQHLLANGVYAPALSYPIVPKDEARLRLQVSAAHTREDLEFVLDLLGTSVDKYDVQIDGSDR